MKQILINDANKQKIKTHKLIQNLVLKLIIIKIIVITKIKEF